MNMRMYTVIATIALLAGWAFDSAPLASAESPEMDGVYTYSDEDGVVATWIIDTQCSPGCVAHVTTAPGEGFTAALVGDRYAVRRTVPLGAVCPPYFLGEVPFGGEAHPVTVYQRWDPQTLVGEVDFLESPAPVRSS